MQQGEIYWCAFPPPAGTRPVLVLTRSNALGFLTNVTVAPLTSTIRNIPSEVRLRPEDGLPRECVASMDNIQTVAKSRLGALITTLPAARMSTVREALTYALGLRTMGV
jgi:mRNA interferase MazF